jgi:predicted kinase
MKKVFCMRGLPGSGKDTYINERWNRDEITVCSADDFFMIDGEYRFDPSKIGAAHIACMQKFLKAIASDHETVVVSNTNINVWEIAPYAAIAAAMDYEFEIIELKAKVEHCIARNSHGVPGHQIGAMSEAMRREIILPRWNVRRVEIKHRDDDVKVLISAFQAKKVRVCFVEDEEDAIIDGITICPDRDSKAHLWLYPSYGDCGWLERTRIPEMVQLIAGCPETCTTQDIEDAVITMVNSEERPCVCGEGFHYPSIHDPDAS